jgi:hypothetical protein
VDKISGWRIAYLVDKRKLDDTKSQAIGYILIHIMIRMCDVIDRGKSFHWIGLVSTFLYVCGSCYPLVLVGYVQQYEQIFSPYTVRLKL